MKSTNLINDLITPIGAFIRLKELNPVFLFESVEKSDNAGRYSFIGLDPVSTITYDIGDKSDIDRHSSLLNMLRQALKSLPVGPHWNRRFPAGLVGLTGFEMFHEFAGIRISDSEVEKGVHDAIFVIPRFILVFDHINHNLSVFQMDRDEPEAAILAEILSLLRSASPTPVSAKKSSEVTVNMTADGITSRIKVVQEHISKGEIYQAVLSARFSGETEIEPFQIYRALRYNKPSPYLYYLRLNGTHVLGSSPETLVRLENDEVTIRPLSGLRNRPAASGDEPRVTDELLADEVEHSKHMLFVDQARNDSNAVCKTKSMKIPVLKTPELYSHEVNLISEVTGEKRPDVDMFDVFSAAFPAGTVTGAPKKRAAEIIAELEGSPRGAYAGSVGYFASNGTMEHAIAIRTMIIRNGKFSTQAGVCITADSDPKTETETILEKGRTILKALDIARDCL